MPRLMNKNGDALTLWFREHEQFFLEKRAIKSSIRFGDRSHGTLDSKGGYGVGSIIKLLIIKANGEFADFVLPVRITSVEVKKMFTLGFRDFLWGPPDQNNRTNLCTAFRKYYGELLCQDEVVSVIRFEYLT